MLDREINPDKYIAPENWYKYGNDAKKPYKIRILPDAIPDNTYLRTFYEQKLMSFPDVFDVHRAVEFTGYNVRTVHQWIRTQKLKALNMNYKYMIPKCYFLDWLCSPEYNSTNRKSKAHVNMLWEVSESLKKLSVHPQIGILDPGGIGSGRRYLDHLRWDPVKSLPRYGCCGSAAGSAFLPAAPHGRSRPALGRKLFH